MLDKLFETIETLKVRIEEHKSYFDAGGKPEARTRAALIDPMLSALGWDVTDPDKVEIEPQMADQRWADYALLDHDRVPVLFIEAKKLAESNSKARQVVSYTVTENMENPRTKVRYCAWTNGDTWVVYDTHPPQKEVMRVTISSCKSVGQCALKFLALWYHSMRDNCFSVPVVCSPKPAVTPAERSRPEPEPQTITPSAPDGPMQATYQALRERLLELGDDVQEKKMKNYVAFRRMNSLRRNVASVVERKKTINVYLHVDPSTITLEKDFSRDVRDTGHPGGNAPLQVIIRSREDLRRAEPLLRRSYDATSWPGRSRSRYDS